ncbi:MAG: hypothetical protein JSV32_06500 [Dehalococcoidia bacterium]|nr:MAG: hypothetical protein JSV32_06500 [Dehalococcoidia bacterium]
MVITGYSAFDDNILNEYYEPNGTFDVCPHVESGGFEVIGNEDDFEAWAAEEGIDYHHQEQYEF